MRKLVTIHILILLAFGCSNQNNIKNNIKKTLVKESSITTDEIIKLDSITSIWYWKCDSEKIYAFSPKNKNGFVHIYSYPDFKFLYSYGVRGNGPNEFITVNWGNTYRDNEIILYDIMKKNIYSFISNEVELSKKAAYLLNGTATDELSMPFTMIHQINDSIFLMKADVPGNITLEIADLKNNKNLSTYSGILNPSNAELTPLYDFEIDYKDNIIACAYKYINRVEILNLDNDYKITHKVVIGDKDIQDDKRNLDDANSYYTDIKCDANYIYAVFQGGTNNERKSTIEIYDLDGSGLYKLNLDNYVEIVFISPNSDYLYGYSPTETEDLILKYKIPDLIDVVR